jgi:hypothetical protein
MLSSFFEGFSGLSILLADVSEHSVWSRFIGGVCRMEFFLHTPRMKFRRRGIIQNKEYNFIFFFAVE